jgi:long-chain acyl-CoA synthetase
MAETQLWRGPAETLGGMLRAAGRRYAGRLAVTDRAGRDLTYAQLLERGARFANALRRLGIAPGKRVAAMLEDRSEAVEVHVGIMLAGCVVVHVSARHTAAELTHVLRDSGANALVHTPGVAGVVAEVVSQLDQSELRAVIGIDRSSELDELDYDDLLAGASPVPPADDRVPEDLAILAYTSGTTGRPKGAMVSHRSVIGCARVAPYYYGLDPGSRIAYSASFSFIGTVWAQVFPALWMGGVADIMGKVDAQEWVDRIVRGRAQFTYVSSPRITEFTDAIRRRPEALQTLRTVMHSGSAVTRSHAIELFEVVGNRLQEHWGTTEVVGSLTATRPSDYGALGVADDIFSSVGRALPSADVMVADEDGNPAAPDTAGELWVRTDSMFSRYWKAPDKNADAFRDGWFRTADIGYQDGAGYFYLVGRSADLIVSGGANVYPAEVERVIQEMSGVQQVAVFGLPHERWGETVVAAVVTRPGACVSEAQVVAHCAGQLAGYKKPTRVLFVPDLPVNASQKLDRRALRARYEGKPVSQGQPVDAKD